VTIASEPASSKRFAPEPELVGAPQPRAAVATQKEKVRNERAHIMAATLL
jgi:hypothetical protein